MRKSAPTRFGSMKVRPPLAFAGQRVGLLGGSFNPPHAGHLHISRLALKRLGLQRVWWIVSPGNPLKSHQELRPLAERMAAARTLARDPRIVVTAFEADLPTPYTAATLGFLKRRLPATCFVWLMGADSLPAFHRWRQWREIFSSVPIAVLDRPGNHLGGLAARAARAYGAARLPETRAKSLASRRPPCWAVLTGPLSPVSSTALRARRRP